LVRVPRPTNGDTKDIEPFQIPDAPTPIRLPRLPREFGWQCYADPVERLRPSSPNGMVSRDIRCSADAFKTEVTATASYLSLCGVVRNPSLGDLTLRDAKRGVSYLITLMVSRSE
jgi:hypothetical protein